MSNAAEAKSGLEKVEDQITKLSLMQLFLAEITLDGLAALEEILPNALLHYDKGGPMGFQQSGKNISVSYLNRDGTYLRFERNYDTAPNVALAKIDYVYPLIPRPSFIRDRRPVIEEMDESLIPSQFRSAGFSGRTRVMEFKESPLRDSRYDVSLGIYPYDDDKEVARFATDYEGIEDHLDNVSTMIRNLLTQGDTFS